MYKVSIYNDGKEIVIHYPTSDKDAPHLDRLPLKEGLSSVDSLSFYVYSNNPGYNDLFELSTLVKVIDIRDDSVRFSGRVLTIDEEMDSSGAFHKNITCEGALSFLNDTKQRTTTFANSSPKTFLTSILNIHNGKVPSSREIQVGNVDVTGSIAYTCNFETTLSSILTAREKIGGDIRVRETSGVLYLDWLKSLTSDLVYITLGENMKDMVRSKDISSLGTRIIPLGANNLTIESVNGGRDYIRDTDAEALYGVIEKVVEYRDIEDPTDLYNVCSNDMPKYTQPIYVLETNALDLSYLTGRKAEQFVTGAGLTINNPLMNVSALYKIVEMDLDLLQPYDPKLTIANNRKKFTKSVNDLRKTTIQNNGVYNNVQVGDAFGIRVVRSDGQVMTTINATKPISIQNGDQEVFFVDADGNVIAKLLRTSNSMNYMILEDQFITIFDNDNPKLHIGYMDINGEICSGIQLGDDGACMYLLRSGDRSAKIGNVTSMYGDGAHINFSSDDKTIDIIAVNARANGLEIATKDWVSANFAPIV